MRDVGFTPERSKGIATEMRSIASASIDYGWRVPAVKWLMVSSIPLGAVGIYAFYALQPYLLELKGDPEAYGIAGLTAAIVAGAQIVGGLTATRLRGLFHRRTSALIAATVVSALASEDPQGAMPVDPWDAVHTLAVIDAARISAAGERVVVVDTLSAKGLEWDATLVLDPDAIVAESPGGVRVLYVALTRAAHRMAVLRPVD